MLGVSKNSLGKSIEENFDLPVYRTLATPRTTMVLQRWMLGILLLLFIIIFLPWQQNINGKGTVTALTPQDRPQNIQNPIAGRIETWRVQEGQLVKSGDTLLVISEIKDDYFDPQLTTRLREQISAKDLALESYQNKAEALQNQIVALQKNQELSLQKARSKIKQNQAKVLSDSTDMVNERLQAKIAQDRYERGQEQLNQGIISLAEWESRKLKLQETQAKLVSVENKLKVSRQELINSQIELASVLPDYQEKISKAQSDLNSAIASLADGQSEKSKLVNKKANVEVRQGLYIVKAPQDGYVVRALKAGIGETIKEGESICTLQPANPQMAVELYVRAMDVPLIQKDREVRLQFEGWPAMQFSGWPSVSVGTFGGNVRVIDMIESAKGDYRILVVPKQNDEKWPPQLRMGSGVYGWIMLDNVPIWYELWRQLNSFPPSLKEEPKKNEEKK